MLTAPLLSRLHGPEDFGLIAVYARLLTLISVVFSLRCKLAIHDRDWHNLPSHPKDYNHANA